MTLDLYELNNIKYKFIKEIIYKYNEKGFYTYTSQPGKIQHLENGKIRKQMSYIRGYMDIQMSRFIVSKLSNFPRLFVRDEQNNKIINSKVECDCGSVIFIDNKPGTNAFDVGEFDQSFNLGLPLSRPYSWYLEQPQHHTTLSDLIPKDMDTKTITEFDIMCLDWNTNDMWEILLDTIVEYHKTMVN